MGAAAPREDPGSLRNSALTARQPPPSYAPGGGCCRRLPWGGRGQREPGLGWPGPALGWWRRPAYYYYPASWRQKQERFAKPLAAAVEEAVPLRILHANQTCLPCATHTIPAPTLKSPTREEGPH